jgi:putative inorganic carbon (hco3(-)) transporter
MTTPSDPSEFFAFNVKPMWAFFKKEHFAFWAISCYLFFEFVRPQSIFPQIDVLPYAQLFLILALAGAFVDPSVKWVSSPANKWIIFYLVWIIAATFTANYPDISKKHFMDFFGWFLIYFLMINIINSEKRFYIAVTIYLVAAAKIAIGTAKTWVMRGFSFTSWGLMGPHGYFHNSGELAVLMVMLFPLSYYLYAYGKPFLVNWQKYLLMLFWIAPILTVLGASSRGAQVALAGQLILMFRKSLFKIKPLIGIVILINAIIFLLPQEQKDRFTTAGDDRTSQQRLLYWKHGATMIEENPFLGVGYFNFASYYQEHYSYDLLYSHAQLPHNILVQIGTDAGVPALLAFFMMLLFCMRTPFTSKKVSPISQYIGYGLGMGVMGYFIAGQFVTITYYPFFWIHLAFMTALFNLNAQASRPGNYLTSHDAQAPQNPGNLNR